MIVYILEIQKSNLKIYFATEFKIFRLPRFMLFNFKNTGSEKPFEESICFYVKKQQRKVRKNNSSNLAGM